MGGICVDTETVGSSITVCLLIPRHRPTAKTRSAINFSDWPMGVVLSGAIYDVFLSNLTSVRERYCFGFLVGAQ
jgi:hypothetical protein